MRESDKMRNFWTGSKIRTIQSLKVLSDPKAIRQHFYQTDFNLRVKEQLILPYCRLNKRLQLVTKHKNLDIIH